MAFLSPEHLEQHACEALGRAPGRVDTPPVQDQSRHKKVLVAPCMAIGNGDRQASWYDRYRKIPASCCVYSTGRVIPAVVYKKERVGRNTACRKLIQI